MTEEVLYCIEEMCPTTGEWSLIDQESQRLTKQQCKDRFCLLYTSPSPRDLSTSRMPSSA